MATIFGTKKKDTLAGTALNDSIFGLRGNDILKGFAGDDNLYGGNGDDQLFGGDGNDFLEGGGGADVLNGGNGTDEATYRFATSGVVAHLQLVTSPGTPAPSGDALGDTYISIENLSGSTFNDVLFGDGGNNVIKGGPGNDIIWGHGGTDTLFGGTGSDTLFSGTGADSLNGGADYDTVEFLNPVTLALDGSVASTGDAAGDTFTSIEQFNGSEFADTLIGDGTANIFDGKSGDDTLLGQGGDDFLYGGGGADKLYGGNGADTLIGGAGADTFDGGDGFDVVQFLNPVTLILAVRVLDLGDAVGDTFINIEQINGSDFADLLAGDGSANIFDGKAGDDALVGENGDDVLYGGDGNDLLYGGEGIDTLTGGTGSDTFRFWTLTEGGDTITDFDVAVDTIEFFNPSSGDGLGHGGQFFPSRIAVGGLAPNELVHGTIADQAFSQVLIAANGDLFYDADGTGNASANILIAHLTGINAANFTNANIIVL